jgi:hypothetical protein
VMILGGRAGPGPGTKEEKRHYGWYGVLEHKVEMKNISLGRCRDGCHEGVLMQDERER